MGGVEAVDSVLEGGTMRESQSVTTCMNQNQNQNQNQIHIQNQKCWFLPESATRSSMESPRWEKLCCS